MKTRLTLLSVSVLLAVGSAHAALHYVDANSPSPGPPYTNWTTAARVIQDAVDAAVAGDEIVVTDGVYATGGRAVGTNLLVNRVAVDKPLTLRSVNGPVVTIIQGHQVPGTTNGDGAIRCVYLADGASLCGFTLTNGATLLLNDAWPHDSFLRSPNGGGVWCESESCAISNCVLVDNSASWLGGGAYQGTLNNCTLSGNRADRAGGGAAWSQLNNCTLMGNVATDDVSSGGGATYCTLHNSALIGNSAKSAGGGADWSTLVNCTVSGNSVVGLLDSGGGGVDHSTLNNCIVYFNTAPAEPNYDLLYSELNFCCTTPLPAKGEGNISLDPLLASATHLSAISPCRGAGSTAYISGSDIDCETWGSPPSIGCDEFDTGAVTGPLSVSISASYTNVATGFSVELTALVEGRTSASKWDFGDGTVVNNRPFATHAWMPAGQYNVTATAYNGTHPEGVTAALVVHVATDIHYVAAINSNPVFPYTSWATAATNIQDAVDAAGIGGTVLVTNGAYASGWRTVSGPSRNRVVVDKPLTLRSVNGPEMTIIQGYQVPGTTNGDGAVRCVYLADGASLSGFTLTNGATQIAGDWYRDQSGGGLWCASATAVASNCVIIGNAAWTAGGGAFGGTLNKCTLTANSSQGTGEGNSGHAGGAALAILNDCTLSGNSARQGGGGAAWGLLTHCTLTGNSARYGGGANLNTLNYCTLIGNSAEGGGGAVQVTLNNCILINNSAGVDGGGAALSTLNNCTLAGNVAGSSCGGAAGCSLNNCTIVSNSAQYGGGVGPIPVDYGWAGFALKNCIVYFNTATEGANYAEDEWSSMYYCCTTPLPNNGVGNITNAPLFVDYVGGNLRLQSNSPCINTGLNAYAPGTVDLDGNPRIVSGTVDIGAYEYQGPGSLISYAWLQQYGLPTDGSADAVDLDFDGHSTWQEWRCQTCPTNALSALRLLSASADGTNVIVSWQSVEGVNYILERSTDLSASPPFLPLASGLEGQPGTTSFTDTNAAGLTPLFYRVGVGN